jgi:hypothetical protein
MNWVKVVILIFNFFFQGHAQFAGFYGLKLEKNVKLGYLGMKSYGLSSELVEPLFTDDIANNHNNRCKNPFACIHISRPDLKPSI